MWCVRVPTGAFVARRNGKVFVTGNSGFPKSLDISKAIDKAAGEVRAVIGLRHDGTSNASGQKGAYNFRGRDVDHGSNALTRDIPVTSPSTPEAALWSGYGTALKPAYESIIVAMKPCEGTFAANALEWGVAGLAIDAGRIAGVNPSIARRDTARRTGTTPGHPGEYSHTIKDRRTPEAYCANHAGESLGRWPANVILDEESSQLLDRQSGTLKNGGQNQTSPDRTGMFGIRKAQIGGTQYAGDFGGASRFFYCAKASRSERGEGNTHPTVKPLKLCEYLAKLILPPERDTPRRLIVPFCGSGSEMIGALKAGWDRVTGIERKRSYIEMAEARLTKRFRSLV